MVLVFFVSMCAAVIFGCLWLLKLIMRKPAKKTGWLALLMAAACIGSCMMTCSHEYVLAESAAATCEEDGYEKYRCSLCDGEKTEKLVKLGHDMADGICVRCGYAETTVVEPEPEDGAVDLTVSFDEIYKAYKENELVADDLYQYNRYRVTAKINGMTSDGLFNLTGGATLTMEKRVGNTRVFFYAEFEKEQEEALKTVKVGETITFDGECLSAGTWVDCELITE